MANPSVSDSNNRIEDMEGSPSNTNIGSGQAGGTDADFLLQGTQSFGRKINTLNTDYGFWITVTSVNMTAGDDNVWMAKILLTNKDALNAGGASGGIKLRLGSGTGAYHGYLVADEGTLGDNADLQYPTRGGWLILPIDPNVSSWRTFTQGSPSLTAVTHFAVTASVTSVAKEFNIFMDSIDLSPGLFIVGGDGASPNAQMQDFVDDDKNEVTAGRFGHVFDVEGTFVVYGTLVIGETSAGTLTETDWTENNSTIVFPGGRVDAGWNGFRIAIDGIAANDSVIRFANVTTQGRGRDNIKEWFSSAGSVDGANEEIDFLYNHRLNTGDAVLYSDEGGTESIGLTDATEYWVEKVTDTSISLHTTLINAWTAATPVNLTASAAANSEQHSLTRQPDTRPDFTIDGNNGSVILTNVTFQNYRNMVFNDAATVTDCRFIDCNFINMANASTNAIDGCSFLRHSTPEGVAYINLPDAEAIQNCEFDLGSGLVGTRQGHAIEVDTAGTYDITGNTFLNYGPSEVDFNASTDVNGTTNVITVGTTFYDGVVDGDAVFYEDRGGTVLSGLTVGARYYVRKTGLGPDTLALYRTREDADSDTQRISLTAGSSENHSLCSARAALVNTSNGTVTINVLGGGDLPSFRSTGDNGVTVVQSTVTLAVTGVTEGTRVSMTDTNGTSLLNDLAYTEDADGTFSGSAAFAYTSDTIVTVSARSSGKMVGAILDDGGVQTELIEESNDVATNLTLTPATPVVGDFFAFGHPEQFTQMAIEFGTVGSGFTLAWEYWDGSTWAALTETDGTSDFTQTGIVSWDLPNDWDTRSFLGVLRGGGPYYWVRARIATVNSPSQATANKVTLDVTRYVVYEQDNVIGNTGLSVRATWIVDPVSRFPTSL